MNSKLQIITFVAVFLFISQHTFGQLHAIKNGWLKSDLTILSCGNCDSTINSDNQFGIFKSGEKYGFLNAKSASFTSPLFLSITNFDKNQALAKTDKGWHIIDTLGKTTSSLKCHYAYAFSEDLARIQLGNRFGYVNRKGELVIPVKYQGAYDFHEGRARVFYSGKWGVIDQKGTFIVAPKYDYIWDYSEGLASVMTLNNREEKWGFIDLNGKSIIEQKYGYVFPFSDGLAIVKKQIYPHGDLFLINSKNEIKFNLNYKDIFPHQEGLACIMQVTNGKHLWGYIDINNEIIIEPQFDLPADFHNGLALVSKDGVKMYIDKNGKIIWKE